MLICKQKAKSKLAVEEYSNLLKERKALLSTINDELKRLKEERASLRHQIIREEESLKIDRSFQLDLLEKKSSHSALLLKLEENRRSLSSNLNVIQEQVASQIRLVEMSRHQLQSQQALYNAVLSQPSGILKCYSYYSQFLGKSQAIAERMATVKSRRLEISEASRKLRSLLDIAQKAITETTPIVSDLSKRVDDLNKELRRYDNEDQLEYTMEEVSPFPFCEYLRLS